MISTSRAELLSLESNNMQHISIYLGGQLMVPVFFLRKKNDLNDYKCFPSFQLLSPCAALPPVPNVCDQSTTMVSVFYFA